MGNRLHPPSEPWPRIPAARGAGMRQLVLNQPSSEGRNGAWSAPFPSLGSACSSWWLPGRSCLGPLWIIASLDPQMRRDGKKLEFPASLSHRDPSPELPQLQPFPRDTSLPLSLLQGVPWNSTCLRGDAPLSPPGLPLCPRISALLSPGCTATGSPQPHHTGLCCCGIPAGIRMLLPLEYGTNSSGAALALEHSPSQ